MFSALRNAVLAATAGLCLTAAANAEPTAFTDTLGTTVPNGSFSYDGAPQTVSDFVVAFAANSWIALSGCAGTPPNAAGAMTRRIAIYARCSTEEQTTENQIRELQAVASRHGWDVAAEFDDNGISGGVPREDRPAMKALLRAVGRREVDIVAA